MSRPEAPKITMRCVRHRASPGGDILLRYETSDGRSTEVQVRSGWCGPDHAGGWDISSRQAAEVAKWRFTARPGDVRHIRSYVADGRHWDLWENTAGIEHAVCVSPEGARQRRLTYAESKAIAKERLRGRS
jgi:hypothetical protein